MRRLLEQPGLLAACLAGFLVACSADEQVAPPPVVSPVAAPAGPSAPASPAPGASPAERSVQAARQILEGVCRSEASAPDNPWGLAHGLLAFGAGFTARDGAPAVSRILTFAETQQVRGREVYGFPQSRGEQRIEPHAGLMIKSMVEVGVSRDHGQPSLQRLVEDAAWSMDWEPGQAFHDPDDVAWLLQALCVASRDQPRPLTIGPAQGTPAQLAEAGLELLRAETSFLAQARAAGQPVQKRRQHIFGHTCGGAHLLQAAVACEAAGLPGTDQARSHLNEQLELAFWRYELETQLITQMLQRTAASGQAQLGWLLLMQDVKFVGHFLETVGGARLAGLLEPTSEQRRLIEGAWVRLAEHVQALKQLQVYDRLPLLGSSPDSYQWYLDLVGDACHAVHAFALNDQLENRPDGATNP